MLLCFSTSLVFSQNNAARALQPVKTAFPFASGFARIENGAQTYYIDTTGSYAFDRLFPVENSADIFARFNLVFAKDKVTQKNKWGIIKEGQWILKPVYDSIDTRYAQWKVKQNGKVSWCDTTGKLLVPLRFSEVGYLNGHLFDVRQNGKWGIYNATTDSMIIPLQYESFDYCGGCSQEADYVLAKKNGKWGVLGFDNKVRVPFQYQHEHAYMRSDEWVYSLQRNNKQVLINMHTGKIFAEPDYEFPSDVLWNNLVCLKKNNKYGLLTATGKQVAPFEYDYITWFTTEPERAPYYACVERDGKYGIIDTTGKHIIPIKHKAFIWAYNDSTFYVNREGSKLLLDRSGNNLLPDSYTDILDHDINGQPPALYSVVKDNKFGLYDRRSGMVTPLIYDDLYAYRLPGFIVSLKDDKLGLFNLQGKELFPPIYNSITRDADDTSLLRLKIYPPEGHTREGLATTNGSMLLPVIYNAIEQLNKGNKWLLRKDSSYFIYNMHTGTTEALPFSQVSLANRNELLLVSNGKDIKLFDAATNRIIAEGFESLYPFQEHAAIAVRADKMGAIDAQGKSVIPFIYHLVSELKNGLAVVQNHKEQYGVVDSLGREILPLAYNRPENFYSTADYISEENILLFKEVAGVNYLLRGLAQKDGKVVAPPQYDILWKDENGARYVVRKDKKYGILATDGTFIIPPIYNDIQMNGYAGTAKLTFPLLCYDGKHWKYITLSGKVLPVMATSVGKPD